MNQGSIQWLWILALYSCSSLSVAYKFALVPKRVNSMFFGVARDGCLDRAAALTASGTPVECLYTGAADFDEDGSEQVAVLEALLEDPTIDGFSVSIVNAEAVAPVLKKATEKGIPFCTFDSDAPDSGRLSYIGTDNEFLGKQLGKVLQKISPVGGMYAILTDKTPNIVQRENGIRKTMQRYSPWKELEPPIQAQGNYTSAIEKMRQMLRETPELTAIVPTMGGPMFLQEEWTSLVTEFPDTIFVVADDLPVQLALQSRSKVQGLVGQLPYQMGSMSIDSLLTLAQTPNATLPEFQGTNVLEHLEVPLVLPPLIVDEKELGALSIIGWVLFGILLFFGAGFTAWTFVNRSVMVVKLAQPGFLGMVGTGCLIMGSSLVPLSLEDFNDEGDAAICMAVPWLFFLGFTITFSALFAKTWRVNRMFQASATFRRTAITTKDVILPFFVLFLGNLLSLVIWTVRDPLIYVRRDAEGVDAWNRVLSTYGMCESEHSSTPYMVVLGTLNVGVLMIASYEAFKARGIENEFSEAQYIATSIVSMLQAALIGSPVLFLVRYEPQAKYLITVFVVFVVCLGILLLIFVPKIVAAKKFQGQSQTNQLQLIQDSIAISNGYILKTSKQRSKQKLSVGPSWSEACDPNNDAEIAQAYPQHRPSPATSVDLSGTPIPCGDVRRDSMAVVQESSREFDANEDERIRVDKEQNSLHEDSASNFDAKVDSDGPDQGYPIPMDQKQQESER